MKQLAFITQGDSDYADRLWKLLDESGIDPHEFHGLDYFGLTPFFVLAGAAVRPQGHTHGDELHLDRRHATRSRHTGRPDGDRFRRRRCLRQRRHPAQQRASGPHAVTQLCPTGRRDPGTARG